MSELAAGNKDACVSLLDQARETAGEIEHNEERIRTLCEIGNHYVETGRNDLAIGAYDAAKEEAEHLDNIHRDSFLAAAVMGFLHAGSIDTADRTLDLITDKTQMANCLLAFSRLYWEKDEKDDALEALDEAYQILRSQRDLETRDSRARYALFGSIAAQFAGFERAERAVEIAQEIEDEGQQTAALAQIAAILAIRRDDKEARHALNAIADDADRAFALIGMSDAKEKIGDHTDAIALLDEAAHLADAVPQLSARSSVYNEIARRYSEYNEMQKAANICQINLQTIAAIRDESRQVICLTSLAYICEQAGLDLAEAENSLMQSILTRTAR
jgi:tetratricopeptide (TPR) repeat protein